jgi:phosphoribosylformimino-5-aminoimidazole carboxamide ribotide isomerase
MTNRLEIIPAIDLRDGRCVRLFQGDFGRETIFGQDPPAMARRWAQLGANRLHLVDLDGARTGAPVQLEVIAAITRAVEIPVELGGGMRSIEHLEAAFAAGVDRVVLGTAAVGLGEDDSATRFRLDCLDSFGDRIVIGLDARDGKLAVRGWVETTAFDAFDFATRLAREGFRRIIYTDIGRDATLTGPNLEHLERLTAIDGLAIIASGGISSTDDLLRLARGQVEAAIVGQALYTGAIDLSEALQALKIASTRGRG